MSIYMINYQPGRNIISNNYNSDPNSNAIIFCYEILRCENHAEVRIWRYHSTIKMCIHFADAEKSDEEIIAEVNAFLDDAIDYYMYEFFANTDEDVYCNSWNSQDTTWRD